MLLSKSQIQEVLEKTKQAFPNLTDWEWNNQKNQEYFGFTLWGQYVLDPSDFMSRCFFITLETYEEKWRGILTIGQHSYLWSSADVGDAHLIYTDDYDTVEEAITALKKEILNLSRAFSAI